MTHAISLLRAVTAGAFLTVFAATASAGDYDSAKTRDGMKDDIVDVAVQAGSFTTLATALKAAGLVDTLKGDGPFTVFAPTDEAFAKLPAGTVESLLAPENKDRLIAILTYHVVPGKITSSDIAGKTAAVATVQGGKLSVDATDGVKVDEASVVKADIEASNGVIHVIDTVVLPK